MTEMKPSVTNLYDLARALGRWDNDGGATGPAPEPEPALSNSDQVCGDI